MEFSSIPSGLRLSLHLGRHSRGRRVPLRRQRLLVADALHAGIEIDHVKGILSILIDNRTNRYKVEEQDKS